MTTPSSSDASGAADRVLFSTIPTASGHVFGRATLNVPASLNALDLGMVDALAARFDAWLADPAIAGIVLDANGEKAFCAGGDVIGLYRAIREAGPGNVPAHAADFFEREYRLDHRIHTARKPVLCWGHGIVMGGGIGLMSGASHRVVTPRTRLAMPEITLGLYPDVGGSWFLARTPGRAGEFLALTGAPLNANDAIFAGLGDVLLDHADHRAVLEAIAAARWQGDGTADAATLGELLAGFPTPAAPPGPLRAHLDRINAVIGLHDSITAIAPRLAALADDADPWLAAAGAAFAKGSPTSAWLSLEMQRRARHASLADVFRLEYQASLQCCTQPDFAEGVRALLVDKDKNPQWQPPRLDAVTPASIAQHLRPPFEGAHPLADLA